MALNVTGLNKFHSFKLADHITTVITNFIYDCENFAHPSIFFIKFWWIGLVPEFYERGGQQLS